MTLSLFLLGVNSVKHQIVFSSMFIMKNQFFSPQWSFWENQFFFFSMFILKIQFFLNVYSENSIFLLSQCSVWENQMVFCEKNWPDIWGRISATNHFLIKLRKLEITELPLITDCGNRSHFLFAFINPPLYRADKRECHVCF